MIRIEHLYKVFGYGTVNEKLALQDVNLTIEPGEFVTIIGSNGAGKSTLMNCLSGVEKTDNGNIFLNKINITKYPEHKRSRYIGRVFQDPMKGTAFDMTIEQNLAIAFSKDKFRGLQKGISKKEKAIFRERLSLLGMGLEDRMTQKVKLLSGGQRQALTLFMAILVSPKLLLLDEHTAALDPATAKKVLELTDQFANSNDICTMMITHNMSDALQYGTRTILMDNGKIIMDISGEERKKMTVEKLIEQFEIQNDRMLLK
ncbi:ABC transporter ATP-binding protein [Sinanaerobacter sp. ZZT-01]|uniref:ABC transporter ATP-binding protein n=1 Tax=Sinanaerobacter sp. ZZT-01 TaxID=3111540 RepID=UPI002D79616E|nr:ATP-binding cassette domain-containing protein [Sinanaerobacter sp. ZZT-01]WRR93420.1 ATP-binding cassette domain-containing protein [Sinanaerobacter sp. ZZT-01]